MKTMSLILKEHYENAYLIFRLSLYDLKTAYISNRLGLLWLVLNPMLQIAVYWVVFGLGIRGGAPVGDTPFVIWLICGVLPFFYISSGIIQGARSIHSKLSVVSKMKFPLSVLPTSVVITQLYSHIVLVMLLIVIVATAHGLTFIGIVGLLYYVVLLTIFLIALAFLTSTLTTLVRDFQLLVQSVTRMLFYLTPIMWTMNERTPDILRDLMRWNPFQYFIEGYRDSLLLGNLSQIATMNSLYIAGLIILMFIVGAWIHTKSRASFMDQI
jgi:ABC-type polysaccharide/polyol phosphate export systems, permease component